MQPTARLGIQFREAQIDSRDVLVVAGFTHEDWPQRLDDYLDPIGIET